MDTSPIEPNNAATAYRVSVRYLEVPSPAGFQYGAIGWTNYNLKATYATCNAVKAVYSSLDGLTLNVMGI